VKIKQLQFANDLAANSWNNCFQKSKENTTDLHQSMYCYLLFV